MEFIVFHSLTQTMLSAFISSILGLLRYSAHFPLNTFIAKDFWTGRARNISVWYSSENCRTPFQITSLFAVAFGYRINCSALTGQSIPISLLSEWDSIGNINNPLKLRLWHNLAALYKISFNKPVKLNLSAQ